MKDLPLGQEDDIHLFTHVKTHGYGYDINLFHLSSVYTVGIVIDTPCAVRHERYLTEKTYEFLLQVRRVLPVRNDSEHFSGYAFIEQHVLRFRVIIKIDFKL